MGSGMKFREFFRVSRDISQSISLSSNSRSQLMVYAQGRKTKQQKRRLKSRNTACRAPDTVRTPMPHDAAGPAKCPCVTRMRVTLQNHCASALQF
jgi:hypothetical protein